MDFIHYYIQNLIFLIIYYVRVVHLKMLTLHHRYIIVVIEPSLIHELIQIL